MLFSPASGRNPRPIPSTDVRTAVLLSLLLAALAASAQHGIAPSGYYPASYRGDTFTGTVASVDPATDTVTLEYKKDSQGEVLPVRLEGGCKVPSKTGEPMRAKNIPPGTVLKAYYMGKTEKRDGQKQRVYVAVGISFLEWQGKPVSEANRHKLYRCGAGGGWQYYRAFAGQGRSAAAEISPSEIVVPPPD